MTETVNETSANHFNVQVSRIVVKEKSDTKLRAHVDLDLTFAMGGVKIFGASLIQNTDGSLWLGLPQKPGKKEGKFFPVVELSGTLMKLCASAAEDAYRERLKAIQDQSTAENEPF